MIITLIILALFIFGIVIAILDNRKWLSEKILIPGVVSFVFGIIGIVIVLTTIFVNNFSTQRVIKEKEMQYESLISQMECIDSDYEDLSKSQIIKSVYDWNIYVYNTKYYAESIWTNWLCNQKFADSLQYIEY